MYISVPIGRVGRDGCAVSFDPTFLLFCACICMYIYLEGTVYTNSNFLYVIHNALITQGQI